MQKSPSVILLSVFLALSIILSGCQLQDQSSTSNAYPVQKVEAPDCSYGGEIRSVESLDRYTVVFSLCKADAAFLAKISHPIFAVEDSAVLEKTGGDSSALSTEIVGAGAYQMSGYTPGKEVVLVPSATYWGVPPKPQKIIFRWVRDPIVRYHEFQDQNADILLSPPSGLIMILRDTAGIKEISTIGLNTVFLGINNQVKPLDNVKVRQALAELIDREDITQSYMVQGSETASQLVPSRISPGFSGNIPWYSKDANAARSLLQEAGFDFNQHLTLIYPDQGVPGVDSVSVIAQELKSELAGIGVKLDLNRVSEADLHTAIASGTEMLYLSWLSADYPDGLAFFEKAFINGEDVVGGSYPDLAAATSELQAVSSAGARQAAFDKVNQLIKEQVPFVPIGHALDSVFIRSTVSNLATNGIYENFDAASTKSGELLIYLADEPKSFWPSDETDPDTFTITRLLQDTLLEPSINGKGFDPRLAESWESNPDLTKWTFHLRYDVLFSNSASLDANDVVSSFAAIWDRTNPAHKGRNGEFTIFKELFGNFIH